MSKAKFIRISPDEHKKLRLLAAESGKSLIKTINDLVSDAYRKQSRTKARR
jgi:predicted HicB family RNase H-like nuclease